MKKERSTTAQLSRIALTYDAGSPWLITLKLYICCCSFLPSFPCALGPPPTDHFTMNLWTLSAEQNLIGSLVGITARLTTGYTISLSNHALKLIYITLSYNVSADPRPTPIAHLGRGWRPACSPAAHMLYFYAPPLRLRRNTHRLPKSDYRYIYLINKPTKLK